jgi:putative hemolysin
MERIAEESGSGRQRAHRRISVGLAVTEPERRAAQRLRWRVFADEMGARLDSPEHGIDSDVFDPFCDHLVVREEPTGEVVGTYRLLPPHSVERLGCSYTESEFDIGRLADVRDSMVEAGRACIHPDYRTGAVLALLWSGIARYMMMREYRYLAGCASVSMADGGHAAAGLFREVSASHLAPEELRVFPRCRLPLERLEAPAQPTMPPLLRAYLRCGAYVAGEPAWDPDFNCADFFIFLPLARLQSRFAQHFLGRSVTN